MWMVYCEYTNKLVLFFIYSGQPINININMSPKLKLINKPECKIMSSS